MVYHPRISPNAAKHPQTYAESDNAITAQPQKRLQYPTQIRQQDAYNHNSMVEEEVILLSMQVPQVKTQNSYIGPISQREIRSWTHVTIIIKSRL